MSSAPSRVTVSDAVFGKEFSEDLVHQVVVAYRNAGRAGTKAQKSRSDMSGTTKKSKKQKGGGARHGDYRAPIFVGGGVTFAAQSAQLRAEGQPQDVPRRDRVDPVGAQSPGSPDRSSTRSASSSRRPRA